MRVLDSAVFKLDGFEERATQPLNDGSDHLVAQTIRVDNGAAFERLDNSHDAHCPGSAVDRDLGAGGNVAALLVARRDTEALTHLRFLARPAKRFRGGFEHGAQPRV